MSRPFPLPSPRAWCVAMLLSGAVLALAPVASAASPPAVTAAAAARTIWTIGGNGTTCTTAPDCGDGSAASSAPIGFPEAVALASDGSLYVADYADSEIRRIAPNGVVSLVAGDGVACQTAPSCGDGGPATSAQLAYPTGLALDSHGDLFIADAGDNEIREVTSSGTIERVAGTGDVCSTGDPCGDGGAAKNAQLTSPDGVAVDTHGNLFIADTGDSEIREVTAAGTISTVAGTGVPCSAAPSCGDGGPGTAASLNFPEAVAVDSHGRVYIADDGDNEIRVLSGGTVSRLAGSGAACAAAPACGDGGSALTAQLTDPEGVAVDAAGNVYVADWGDDEIREIDTHGVISRVAGSGSQCAAAPSCGEATTATTAQLSSPHGVAVDGSGVVYVADTYDDLVRVVAPAAAQVSGHAPAIVELAQRTTKSQVSVDFAVSGAAKVTLWVRAKSAWVQAAHVSAVAGGGELIWNRRIGRTAAPHGSYGLALTLGSGRPSTHDMLTAKL